MNNLSFLTDCCYKPHNRRIGKTWNMLSAAANHACATGKEVYYIVSHPNIVNAIRGTLKNIEPQERVRKLVKVVSYRTETMAGSEKPCFIDHYTFEAIIDNQITEIREKDAKIKQLRKQRNLEMELKRHAMKRETQQVLEKENSELKAEVELEKINYSALKTVLTVVETRHRKEEVEYFKQAKSQQAAIESARGALGDANEAIDEMYAAAISSPDAKGFVLVRTPIWNKHMGNNLLQKIVSALAAIEKEKK